MPPIPANNNPYALWANMPPMSSGMPMPGPLLKMPMVTIPSSHRAPTKNVTGSWSPAPHEVQLWVTPAGWAEGAYLLDEHIDVSDSLSFLDQIHASDLEVNTSFKEDTVTMTDGQSGQVARAQVTVIELGGVVFVGPANTYEKVFPDNESRDLILLAENSKGQRAISVVSHLIITRRNLVIRADDHQSYESITLQGSRYLPFKEIQ